MTTLSLIEELQELEKKATGGKWFRNVPTGLIRSTLEGKYVGDKVLTVSGGWRSLYEYDANLDLLIKLRNAFPDICTAYIEQDRKLREAVAALEFYSGDEDHGKLAVKVLSSILPLNS